MPNFISNFGEYCLSMALCFLKYLAMFYYILLRDTSFELPIFWLSDTESRINELSFSESVSLSFKMRLK